MLPLSKQKLRNLIGDENNWAEAPGTYKQLVNDRVFQFRISRQYEQLIQLLIKVRTPKLSKEAFRPSEVKKILNESLQVLTDEDLSAMVSTMERMDALEDTLRDFQAAMRDAAIIRNEYSRYNQYMLGMKGTGLPESACQNTAAPNQLQDVKMDLEKLEQELRDPRSRKMRGPVPKAKAQYAALGEDDLEAQAETDGGGRAALPAACRTAGRGGGASDRKPPAQHFENGRWTCGRRRHQMSGRAGPGGRWDPEILTSRMNLLLLGGSTINMYRRCG